MRTFLVIFFAVLLIAFANALRKANITKPVVKLENRLPPVWNQTPEERRKLSIFPRNNMKFVVTPKTVENNENAAKGLPTKRPLMRKFTMQDRNEKGTWSFVPRKPLMKTNRFTVTLAPPKSSNRKEIDEIPEESKKLRTVLCRPNIEQPSSKNQNLNKSNLIEMMVNKQDVDHTLNKLEKNEKEFVGEEFSKIIKVNDTQDFDIIHINDNSTLRLDKLSKDSTSKLDEVSIDMRSLKHENDFIANENKNKHESVKHPSTDLLKSRAEDLNELKYAIGLIEMDDEESTSQILSLNDLEILLEKTVNNTESSAADFDGNNPSNSQKIETEVTLENILKSDVAKPNEFYDVISHISLGDDKDKNTNSEEDFLAASILHGSQIIEKDKKLTVSETLNGEEDFTKHLADALVIGGLLSLGKETDGLPNREMLNEQRDIVANYRKDIKTNSKPSTSDDIVSNFTNDTEYDIQTEFSKTSNSNDSTESPKEILLEMYESNMSLSSEELSAELEDS